MKKANVDKNLCIACGACFGNVPSVFELGDDGLAEVKVDIIPKDLEDEVMDAASGCPTSAIEIEKQN